MVPLVFTYKIEKSMLEEKKLEFVEINPKEEAAHSIIWLHGLGADSSDFVPIVQELNLTEILKMRFVFPNAPVIPITINNGFPLRAWYDITSLSSHGEIEEKGIAVSTARINRIIQDEMERGVPSNRIFLAGFSQGAVMALTVGLSFSNPLAGIIALSGYLPGAKNLTSKAQHKETPIFIAHGTEDAVVPYALGKAAYLSLVEANADYKISWHSYPIAHSVSAQEIQDLKTWIKSQVNMAL